MVIAVMTSDQSSNPFWEYSLVAYRRAEVAETCLELQDSFGLDVNFLLYAGWLCSIGFRVTEAHLLELEEQVAYWRATVVQPLRTLRRQLPVVGPGEEVREEIKAVELKAERVQQNLMVRYMENADSLPLSEHSLPENLKIVAALFVEDLSGCRQLLLHLTELLET
jgi:uncharacterized protein (TIGR02444 family)